MDDLLGDFLAETTESLDLVDNQLVEFEQDPNNSQILDNIFRLVHTIKGTCGFLGLPRLESVAHAAENLMDRFREGAPVTEEAVSVILAALDRIKEIMADLEEKQEEPEGSDRDLIDVLARLAAVGTEEPVPEEAAAAGEDAAGDEQAAAPKEEMSIPGEVSLEDLDAAFAAADSDFDVSATAEAEAEAAPEIETPAPAEIAAPEAAAPESAAATRDAGKGEKKLDVRAKSVRVAVDTLEKLMTTVSELVLARNQLLEIGRHIEDGALQAPLQRLSSVTGELQERVMKTRMQPIGNAWQKLPRIIRTLANDLDKQIELEMTGADTELDRQVCELIQDPLTHMVRNAADHGLESTEERLKAGKSATGKVKLDARHEGGHIVIEISDDGKGLDAGRIKAKALESGFATAADLESMSDAQVAKLIFEPGLSTADAVTNVSGRGVGMDVVRSNIELIGGSVGVVTVPGEGSKFTIQIPLTLAIVPALIIGAGSQRYAVPQLNIIELVRVRAGDEHSIETVNGSPILRLRGRLLPLVRLAKFFDDETPPSIAPAIDAKAGNAAEESETADGAETPGAAEAADDNRDSDFVAVFRIGGIEFGMVADAVYDTEEIVVKPLSGFLKNGKAFSGNTILGDGSVVMIIDPAGVAEVSGMRDAANTLDASMQDDTEHLSSLEEAVSMLVFQAGSQDPRALPLALINRLEEIDMADIERSSGQDVVQYRGVLMPLIRLDNGDPTGVKPVIVIESAGYYTGLVVDEIVDVVEEILSIEPATSGNGALGSAVILSKVTEIMDLAYYMPETLEGRDARNRNDAAKRVLLIDDSAFFRNMLTPFLSASGLQVTSVSSAAEALEVGRRGHDFDVIVSDLEMPEMTGYQFAEAIKAGKLWANAELIALSGSNTPEAIDKAHASGFSDYVAKFDRSRLLDVLNAPGNEMGVAA